MTVGVFGAVVSNITFTVPVLGFPDKSVIVTVGFDVGNIPLHITAHPVLGFGTQLNHAILVLAPLSTTDNVITTFPLVGFGFAV